MIIITITNPWSLTAVPHIIHTNVYVCMHTCLPPFKCSSFPPSPPSACYFPHPTSTLDEAEEATLNLYAERLQLAEGQEVLELGCGWGSLTLFMAAKYQGSRFTGVSNSATQKLHIMEQCK